jgi:hypothetical protein
MRMSSEKKVELFLSKNNWNKNLKKRKTLRQSIIGMKEYFEVKK